MRRHACVLTEGLDFVLPSGALLPPTGEVSPYCWPAGPGGAAQPLISSSLLKLCDGLAYVHPNCLPLPAANGIAAPPGHGETETLALVMRLSDGAI